MVSLDPSTSKYIVEVDQLSKVYDSRSLRRKSQVHALKGVSLKAGAGEVFGLLGPNGAGKTTLIKSLLGIIRPTAGSARLFGLPIGTRASRSQVGYLPESLRIDRHHTARTALAYYGRLSRMNSEDIRTRSDELLELVGLAGRDRESVRRFSKGMYQRLGLAQALMHNPDLLFLDEPTDGLDPVGRNEVRQVIERLSGMGKTIFLNSHILQEVELVCTQVAILAKGTLRAVGTIDEVRSQFGGDATVLETRLTVCHSDGSPGINRDALRQCLSIDGLSAIQESLAFDQAAATPNSMMLSTQLPDQAAIDKVVDSLRAANYSIQSLHVSRPTLEQTFIRLVGDEYDSTLPGFSVNSDTTSQAVNQTEIAGAN